MKKLIVFLFAVTLSIASFAQPHPILIDEYSSCGDPVYWDDYTGSMVFRWDPVDGDLNYYNYEVAVYSESNGQCVWLNLSGCGGGTCYAGAAFEVDQGEDSGLMRIKVRYKDDGVWTGWNSSVFGAVSVYPQGDGTINGTGSPVQGEWETYTQSANGDGCQNYRWKISGGYFFAEGSTSGPPYSSGSYITTGDNTISLMFVSPPFTNFTIKSQGYNMACGYGDWSDNKSVTVAIP
jgi:hypothetical protein